MKLGSKGIGWLIFGVMICFSVTESDGWRSALSTLVLGAVFISIYLMKQKFETDGIGWYICGGVLLAFIVDAETISDVLISLVIAAACLGVFYYKNKYEVDDMIEDISDGVSNGGAISEYSPEWMNEGTDAGTAPTADDDTVEFDIEVKE